LNAAITSLVFFRLGSMRQRQPQFSMIQPFMKSFETDSVLFRFKLLVGPKTQRSRVMTVIK
jgi:hypothetical protein